MMVQLRISKSEVLCYPELYLHEVRSYLNLVSLALYECWVASLTTHIHT